MVAWLRVCESDHFRGERICSLWAGKLVSRANLDDTGHVQFGGFQPETGIDSTEQQDGEDNGKVSYQGPDLQKNEQVSKAPAQSQADSVLRQQRGEQVRA